MATQYYYQNAAQESVGPVGLPELLEARAAGEIRDDLVYPQGQEQWVKFEEIFPRASFAPQPRKAESLMGDRSFQGHRRRYRYAVFEHGRFHGEVGNSHDPSLHRFVRCGIRNCGRIERHTSVFCTEMKLGVPSARLSATGTRAHNAFMLEAVVVLQNLRQRLGVGRE